MEISHVYFSTFWSGGFWSMHLSKNSNTISSRIFRSIGPPSPKQHTKSVFIEHKLIVGILKQLTF